MPLAIVARKVIRQKDGLGAGAAMQRGCPTGQCPYDAVYFSTQPVGVDGLEIDPVNGGVIVLARAGVTCSITSVTAPTCLSSDAVVKVGGLPIRSTSPITAHSTRKGRAPPRAARRSPTESPTGISAGRAASDR